MVAKAWVENGVVVNLTNASELLPGDIDGTGAAIGDLWDGEQFTKPAEVISVPEQVEMAQARLALLQAGLLSAVEAAIPNMGQAAQIEWEYRSYVRRDNVLVNEVKTLLGWTDQQMDELFVLAAGL